MSWTRMHIFYIAQRNQLAASYERQVSTRIDVYNTQCIHLAASRIISDTYIADNRIGELYESIAAAFYVNVRLLLLPRNLTTSASFP